MGLAVARAEVGFLDRLAGPDTLLADGDVVGDERLWAALGLGLVAGVFLVGVDTSLLGLAGDAAVLEAFLAEPLGVEFFLGGEGVFTLTRVPVAFALERVKRPGVDGVEGADAAADAFFGVAFGVPGMVTTVRQIEPSCGRAETTVGSTVGSAPPLPDPSKIRFKGTNFFSSDFSITKLY
jgi:hypothetical protein